MVEVEGKIRADGRPPILAPCRWVEPLGYVCMFDGVACDGGCENYEPKVVS